MQDPVLLRALCPKALGVFTGGCLFPDVLLGPPSTSVMSKRGHRENRKSIQIRPLKIHVLMLISI